MTRQVAIGAALARRPGVGGHTWVALQWLLGFRALGWEPMLVDWLDSPDATAVRYLAKVMDRFALRDSWAVLVPGRDSLGIPRDQLERRLGSCELLLNIMGYVDPDLIPSSSLRVFLDIDPGFGQMWKALGLADVFDGHDRFVSVGTNVGRDGCLVPDLGLEWLPTLPPVALDYWPPTPGGDDVTSVVTWRGPFGPIDYDGATYGLRVHEFRRFLQLPDRTGATFRLALDIDPGDRPDRARLVRGGWRLQDPRAVAGDPFSYREFVQGSAAELNVAKNMYVETRSGWFSDRSACYLASGKPVLAQDTGFGHALPVGPGLLSFATFEDAVVSTEAVLADQPRHARAARLLAEEHLAAERVIARLLDRLGAS